MRIAVFFCIAMLAAGSLSAQRAGAKFDVISIRPTLKNSKEPPTLETLPGGRLRVRNMYVRALLWIAYGGEHLKIVNEPSWLMEPYDVDAVMEGAPELTQEQLAMPILALLQERCGLAAHVENIQQTVYSLEVDSGAAFRLSAAGTEPSFTRTSEGLEYRGMTMTRFAEMLGRQPDLQTQVTDKTGLSGTFDFLVDYEKISALNGNPAGNAGGGQIPSFDLVSAVGLRLKPEKRAAKTIVIDRIHRPSGN